VKVLVVDVGGTNLKLSMGGDAQPLKIPSGKDLTAERMVGDVRQVTLADPPTPELYISHRSNSGQEMAMVVRTADDPERLGAAVTAAIREVDPEQPVFGVMSMDQVIDNASAERRVSMLLLLLFAAIALLLSALGIYGVMAYTTSQRRQEIGIRMALGAARNDVIRLVVGHAFRLTVLGVGIGLAGAYGVTRLMASVLFGVTATQTGGVFRDGVRIDP